MTNYQKLQNEFRAKIGEVAYTVPQLVKMLHKMGLGNHSSRAKVRYFVLEHDLTVNLEGIKSVVESTKGGTMQPAKHWIPKSKLTDLIDGLSIPATERDFEMAALGLNYQI